MWANILLLPLVCSVVFRSASGAGGRGRTSEPGDRRRHSERVASLRARQTDPAVDQSREETRIRSATRDRSPTSREIVRSCVSAAIQSERGDRQQNPDSLSLGLSTPASQSVHSSQSSRHRSNSRRDHRSRSTREKSPTHRDSQTSRRTSSPFTRPDGSRIGVEALAARSVSDWLDFSTEDLRTSCMAVGQIATGPRDMLARRLSEFYTDLQQRSQPSRLTSPDLRSRSDPHEFNQRNAGSVRLREAPATHMSSSEIQSIIEATVRSLYTDNNNQASSNRPSVAFADSVPAIQSSGSSPSFVNNQREVNNLAPGTNPVISSAPSRILPATTMPNVPETVLEKIREGKFVDLANCIDTHYIDDDQKFSLVQDKGEGDGLSLVKKTRSKKIQNFQEWMKAFSLYLRAVFLIKPALVGQMLVYLSIISGFAGNFIFSKVYSFDKHFRLFLAANPSCRFDQIPDEIYLQYLRHAPAPHSSGKLECFSCGATSHLYQECPQRGQKTSKNTTSSANTGNSNSNVPIMFQLPQSLPNPTNNAPATSNSSPPFCFSFNNNVACKPNCSYRHICWFCRSLKHGGDSCPAKPQ